METLTRMAPAMLPVIRRATAHAIMLCMGLVPALGIGAEADSLEYTVKAAYLTKFGIYVEWPGAAFASPTAPLNLCVIGDDPFGALLDTAAEAQRIDGHPIAVRRVKTVSRETGCHVLYVAASEAPRQAQIVDALRGSAVLTVSDARNGANAATAISFVVKDNRVRFNVDEEAAAQNGLAISSKLLGLALSVKPRAEKGAK